MEEQNLDVKAKAPEKIETDISKKGGRVIDESQYSIQAPKEKGPTAVGTGGDSLFRRIRATHEQLTELLEETQTVQDWVQRETSNNVAMAFLDQENLKDVYYEIKDGFVAFDKKYGKLSLMGFKSPSGAEIPRLKIFDENDDVIEVLTGPMAIDELNKRALAYRESQNGYEVLSESYTETENVIADYDGKMLD